MTVRIATPRGMAGGPRGAAATREGTHPDGRRARTAAPRTAMGPGRERVPVRNRRGDQDAGRAFRGPLPAPRLPLHVRPELRGRLPGLFVERRRRQRRPAASPRARRDDALRLARAAREAPGLQGAGWAGASAGCRRQVPTSTSTSTSRTGNSRCASRWTGCSRTRRRSSATWLPPRGRTSPDTCRRGPAA